MIPFPLQTGGLGRRVSSPSVTYATWNPSDKASIISLSNGNLTFTVANNDATNGFYYLIRATQGKSSGKWYWETTIRGDSSGATAYYTSAALLLSTYALVSPTTAVYPGQSGDSVGGPFHVSDIVTYQNSSGTGPLGTATVNATRTLRHKLDMDAKTYEQALDAGSFFTVAVGLTGTQFPSGFYREGTSGGAAGQTSSSVANFGASAFSYSVPSGYNPGVFT